MHSLRNSLLSPTFLQDWTSCRILPSRRKYFLDQSTWYHDTTSWLEEAILWTSGSCWSLSSKCSKSGGSGFSRFLIWWHWAWSSWNSNQYSATLEILAAPNVLIGNCFPWQFGRSSPSASGNSCFRFRWRTFLWFLAALACAWNRPASEWS